MTKHRLVACPSSLPLASSTVASARPNELPVSIGRAREISCALWGSAGRRKLNDRSEVATTAPGPSVTWIDTARAASATNAATPGVKTPASEHSQGVAGMANVALAAPMLTARSPNK